MKHVPKYTSKNDNREWLVTLEELGTIDPRGDNLPWGISSMSRTDTL